MKNKNKEYRFEFGKNWHSYLKSLNNFKIQEAENSLKNIFEIESFKGKKFLDIGCGSGLFSLAARNLGAEVFSFDYDHESVKATKLLKRKFFSNCQKWKIEQGSVLDKKYMKNFNNYNFIYSWGVLHHTGNMYLAMENVSSLANEKSSICIAIYNKQQFFSKIWLIIKKIYNNSPRFFQKAMTLIFCIYFFLGLLVVDLIRFKNPFERHTGANRRGMNFVNDVIDWIGGYPFEVATPEEIFNFFRKRGFVLKKLKTCGGKMGCNEFMFSKR